MSQNPDQDVPEIKIGDVGTEYCIPIYDNDLALANFDPSAASVKQLVFRMPGAASLLTRDATAVQKTIDGAEVWCLQYIVVAADVVPDGFHQRDGLISVEAHLEFDSDHKFTSSTQTRDWQERPLRIVPRLAA